MLEVTGQPDAGCLVSGGFGFDNRECLPKEPRDGDSHRLEGAWKLGQVRVTLSGKSHRSRTILTKERQMTSLFMPIVSRDKPSVLYKPKQPFE